MYEIDEAVYKRFEQKNNMLFRRLWDKSLSTFGKFLDTNIEHHIESGKDGYSRLDFALVAAGWTVYEKFPFAFAWKREEEVNVGYGVNWMKNKYSIEDMNSFSANMKRVAKLYVFGELIFK